MLTAYCFAFTLLLLVITCGVVAFFVVEKRQIERELNLQRKFNNENDTGVLDYLQRRLGGRTKRNSETNSTLHVTTTLQKILGETGKSDTIKNPLGFEIRHRQSLSSSHMTIIAPWPDSGLRFSLRPDDDGLLINHLLRLDDIQVGALTFDRKYYVQSNEPELTKRLLDIHVQQALMEIGEEFAFTIQSGEARLEFSTDANMPRHGTHFTHHGKEVNRVFLQFIAAFKHMLLRFDHVADFEFIQEYFIGEIKVGERPSPNCLICGEAIVKLAVNCKSCDTPHHEDCWKYAGRCSTFACGEIHFVRD